MEKGEEFLAKKYGEKIKQLRQTHKLTQKEFAEKIGTSQTMIYYWENGAVLISTLYLNRICNAFRLSMSYWDDTDSTITTLTPKELSDTISEIIRIVNRIRT